MADQDFNIKVVTTADTTGLRQTTDEIKKLRQESLRSALTPVPAGLTGQPAGIRSPARPGQYPLPTEEDSRIADRIGHGFERMALHAAGIGAIYAAINAIKQTAADIEKVTESLDKQGELLVENSRHMIAQAKFAADDTDVLKIAEEALKNIATQHKTVDELQKKELTVAQSVADAYERQLAALYGHVTVGQNQARLDKQREEAIRSEEAARRTGIGAVRAGELEKERVSALSTADAIDRLNQKIKEEQALQIAAYNKADIQGYVERGQAIQQYIKQREPLLRKQQKEQETAYDKASPQARAILENEKRAREAREKGDEKSADQFQKTADQFRESALPSDLKSLQDVIDTYGKTPRPGRAAGIGESQEKVDEIERNRLRDEQLRRDEAASPDLAETNKFIEQAGGKPITQAQDTAFKLKDAIDDLGRKFDRYWG